MRFASTLRILKNAQRARGLPPQPRIPRIHPIPPSLRLLLMLEAISSYLQTQQSISMVRVRPAGISLTHGILVPGRVPQPAVGSRRLASTIRTVKKPSP